jgi:trigger factor
MLNIKKENLSGCKAKLTISVPSELMRGYFAKVYNKLAASVEVKGFRAGKAPRNLTIAAIGENRLVSQIIDMALQETYGKALKEENIIPVAPPKINIKKMADLTADTAVLEYEAEIELLPEVKIGDYKKLKVKSAKLKVDATKAEIDQVLSHLQRQHATFKEIDRKAMEGDRVEIDFEGKEQGVVLENLTSKNYPVILGSKVLIPEFEKKVEGMKKGDEKDFKLKIKDKEIDFHVKMLDVKEVILPKLDDELAKKFGKKTLQELTKAIEEDIIKQKNLQEKQNQENQLIEELLKITQVEVPESLILQETNRMVEQLKQRTQMAGMPFEKYLGQVKKTEEDLKKDFRAQAEKTVKVGLTLGEIGKKEKIDLKDKDAGKKVMEKLVAYATK